MSAQIAWSALTVNRVRRIRPLFVNVTKVGKIGGERVAIKVNDVLVVDGAYRIVHPLVKLDDGRLCRVCGLVEGVVPRDPLVPDVVLREFRPQPDRTVLKVPVNPKVGDVSASVGVPVRVLSSGCGVEVENGANTLLGAKVDNAIKMFEALLLEYAGIRVICGDRYW